MPSAASYLRAPGDSLFRSAWTAVGGIAAALGPVVGGVLAAAIAG